MKLRVDRPLDLLQHDRSRRDIKENLKDAIRHLDVFGAVADGKGTKHGLGPVELDLLVGERSLHKLETQAVLGLVLLDAVVVFKAQVLNYLFCLHHLLLGEDLTDVATVPMEKFLESLGAQFPQTLDSRL